MNMNMGKQIVPIEEKGLPYAHWLYNLPGVGSKTIASLLTWVGTPEELYQLPDKELHALLNERQRGRKLEERILSSKQNGDIQEAYHSLEKKQIQFTCQGHAGYPKRLMQIPDAPYGIYYRGMLPDESKWAVAMIGARGCSEYGRHMAQSFGRELAQAGVQIISGMARGIDGIGQKEALEAGGYSLGVMGCGVDVCYPAENRDLYDMLCIQGGICSEYPPGTVPKNSLFPPRNRIISGLSDAVLVIEAKNRSGTLITVDMALEQGKEVYALPGRVTDALSEGCNRLLQQGANIALSPQDMICSLMGQMHARQQFTDMPLAGRASENIRKKSILSETQLDILQSLEDAPQPVEAIKERMLSKCRRELPLPELMNQLVKLSLCGLVKQIGNSYFMRL